MAKKRSPKRKVSPHSSTSPNAQRLNKILAGAGLGSRRKVEELIEQGRVEIDGDIVTDLSCKVEPEAVKIKVDGQLLKKSRPVYFALNKPPGVLSTNYDPSGRMRVIDLVPDRDRVFSVGRLDQSSEGLMLLTNDGDLAQRLAHPRFHIQKTYFVVVAGQMTEDELNKLRKGVHLAEGLARIDGATIKRVRKGCTELEIVLSEGKNREIRRILARAGHKVVLLRRIAIGTLRLGQMPVGASRTLTASEVKALYVASDPEKRIKRKAAKASEETRDKKVTKKPTVIKKQPPIHSPELDDDQDDDLLSLALNNAGAEDEEFDGDFVGDFSGTGGRGSVLAFEDDAPPNSRKSREPKTPREPPIRTAQAARREARDEARLAEPTGKSASRSAGRGQTRSKTMRAKSDGIRSSSDSTSPRERTAEHGSKRGNSRAANSEGGRDAGRGVKRGGTSASGKKSSSAGRPTTSGYAGASGRSSAAGRSSASGRSGPSGRSSAARSSSPRGKKGSSNSRGKR